MTEDPDFPKWNSEPYESYYRRKKEHDDYEKLLNDAYTKWGFGTQALIWIEEMGELITALAKRDRKINPSFQHQIEEEIADVDICLDQAKLLFPDYEKYKERKIARLRRLVYEAN